MKLLVFSSPFHYLIALLIKKYDDSSCLGFYVGHHKDCSIIFRKISDRLGVNLDYIDQVDDFDKGVIFDELVISNRFDSFQIELVEKYKKKVKVSFMEEGASIYLVESHLAKGLSDGNLKLRCKTILRKMLGKSRYFIPMSWFNKGYSFCAANIPYLSDSCELINISSAFHMQASQLKKKEHSLLNIDAVIILSQWFVAKKILSEDLMLEFYQWFVSNHLRPGQVIYYKPHPWDSIEFTQKVKETLGFISVEDEDLPVEIWLAINPNVTLYGFWTSTMFYCDGVLNNKAYSLLLALSEFSDNENVKHQYSVARDLIGKSGVSEIAYT